MSRLIGYPSVNGEHVITSTAALGKRYNDVLSQPIIIDDTVTPYFNLCDVMQIACFLEGEGVLPASFKVILERIVEESGACCATLAVPQNDKHLRRRSSVIKLSDNHHIMALNESVKVLEETPKIIILVLSMIK